MTESAHGPPDDPWECSHDQHCSNEAMCGTAEDHASEREEALKSLEAEIASSERIGFLSWMFVFAVIAAVACMRFL